MFHLGGSSRSFVEPETSFFQQSSILAPYQNARDINRGPQNISATSSICQGPPNFSVPSATYQVAKNFSVPSSTYQGLQSFSVPSSTYLGPSNFSLPSDQPEIFSVPRLNTVIGQVPHVWSSCTSCNRNTMAELSGTEIQVPIQVNLPSGMPSLGQNYMTPKIRRPLENELLTESVSSFQYFPPSTSRRSGMKKQRIEDLSKRIKIPGPTEWYLRRRADQIEASNISMHKLHRHQKGLKRLNNAVARRKLKMEMSCDFVDQEAIRDSKREMLQKRGIKAPGKTECKLWNCPRKNRNKKRSRPFVHLLSPHPRSESRLSNLSKRSRSPIQFRRLP